MCEPFNRRMHHLTLEEAVRDTKYWMDLVFKIAEEYPCKNLEHINYINHLYKVREKSTGET